MKAECFTEVYVNIKWCTGATADTRLPTAPELRDLTKPSCECWWVDSIFFNSWCSLSLEKEVQEVKAVLHTMLSQLKLEDDGEDDDEDEDKYCDVEEGRVEDGDIEEELYFSDSWEIWIDSYDVLTEV